MCIFIDFPEPKSRPTRSRESGATASRSQENELEKRREILDVRERPDAEFHVEIWSARRSSFSPIEENNEL